MSKKKEFIVEFDDALLSLKGWNNPRYDGCKLTAAQINKYTAGDKTYGKKPVLESKTNALYIANVLLSADSPANNEYTTIKKHSYIGISKMLLINQNDDTVTVLDSLGPGDNVGNVSFLGFNRYLTTDFRTGTKFNIKLLDETVQTNLKQGGYFVKMNKGYLYPAFKYRFIYDVTNHDFRNGMYLYNRLSEEAPYTTNGTLTSNPAVEISGSLRFRFANFWGSVGSSTFDMADSTPSFASSSILQNVFTEQYYSGAYGFINDDPTNTSGPSSYSTNAKKYANSGIGKVSKFLAQDTLTFLKRNNTNPNLNPEDKTEVHITFFNGTKDFTNRFNDERSISTFEMDQNQGSLSLGGELCNAGLPKVHEFQLKGQVFPDGDPRFTPTINGHIDDILTSFFEEDGSTGNCNPNSSTEFVNNANIFVQGGNEGEQGCVELQSKQGLLGCLGVPSFTSDNSYSGSFIGRKKDTTTGVINGSFDYEISFLKKDHVIIADVDKNFELPNGIGSKELVLIPQDIDDNIQRNLNYYLQQAGLVDTKITKSPRNDKRFK